MPDQIAASTDTAPARFQCRHIFTDGHRCGSPCLRSEDFCYYHHTTRGSAEHLRDGDNRSDTFELPVPEDRSAIQRAIAQVLQRLAASAIDTKRAGLLLYGLQIASANLPKDQHAQRDNHPHEAIVEEIDLHPELGLLAPQTEAPPPHRTTREQNLDYREREIKSREYELNDRETRIERAERCLPVSPAAPIVESWNLKSTSTQPAILPEIKAVADTTPFFVILEGNLRLPGCHSQRESASPLVVIPKGNLRLPGCHSRRESASPLVVIPAGNLRLPFVVIPAGNLRFDRLAGCSHPSRIFAMGGKVHSRLSQPGKNARVPNDPPSISRLPTSQKWTKLRRLSSGNNHEHCKYSRSQDPTLQTRRTGRER